MRARPHTMLALVLTAIVAATPLATATANELEGLFKRAAQRVKQEAIRKAEDRVTEAARTPLRAVDGAGSNAAPSSSGARGSGKAGARYVAPRADTRIGNVPQSLWLQPRVGAKFEPMQGPPAQVIAVNPYLDPQRPFFAVVHRMQCAADGSLLVSGDGGLDAEGGIAGRGIWKIAADGAVAPWVSHAYGAQSDIPAGRAFTLTPDGALLTVSDDALVRVGTDGSARVLASGLKEPGEPVLDPSGNIWFSNNQGCELLRRSPDGGTTTVIGPDRTSCSELPPDQAIDLDRIAWDRVNGELVVGGSTIVAKPKHDMHISVWRVRPDGQARRVFYTVKGGRSPVGQNTDTIWALTVDAKGRIVVATRLMGTQVRRQLMRVDESRARLVPVTGQAFRKQFGGNDYRPGHEEAPYDGAAASANFREAKDLCEGPDGTLFVLDEHLVRRVDKDGQVRTWAY